MRTTRHDLSSRAFISSQFMSRQICQSADDIPLTVLNIHLNVYLHTHAHKQSNDSKQENIGNVNKRVELWQEVCSVELGVYWMQLFHFWSHDVHPVQNLLLCTKFHKNWMILCWDMAIQRFSKWRPSAILKLFYHHTRPPTKSLLLATAACQISCQSDTHIWRYSYLNFFAYLAWNAYSGSQNAGFVGLWTPKCGLFIIETPKRHIFA